MVLPLAFGPGLESGLLDERQCRHRDSGLRRNSNLDRRERESLGSGLVDTMGSGTQNVRWDPRGLREVRAPRKFSADVSHANERQGCPACDGETKLGNQYTSRDELFEKPNELNSPEDVGKMSFLEEVEHTPACVPAVIA